MAFGFSVPKISIMLPNLAVTSPVTIIVKQAKISQASILFFPFTSISLKRSFRAPALLDITSIASGLSNHKGSGFVPFLVNFWTFCLKVSYDHPPQMSSTHDGKNEGFLRLLYSSTNSLKVTSVLPCIVCFGCSNF